MFTGIVTEIGEIKNVTALADNLSRIEIACGFDAASIALGENANSSKRPSPRHRFCSTGR